MNTTLLQQLGLTHGEIKAYLALLRLGSRSTGPIAKEAQVSRSKLYLILDRLEKKGLAAHVDKGGVTYFHAAEPSRIKELLREKEQTLKQLGKQFDSFLPQLESLQQKPDTVQRVSVYHGLKGLSTVHQYMYLKLKKGEAYYSIGVPITQTSPQHVFWKGDHVRRQKYGIKSKLLFNRDVPLSVLKNRNSYPGCDARYMPINVKTPTYFEIYADTVMIIVPSDPAITIEIISKEIAKSFMLYFHEFWKHSKKCVK